MNSKFIENIKRIKQFTNEEIFTPMLKIELDLNLENMRDFCVLNSIEEFDSKLGTELSDLLTTIN